MGDDRQASTVPGPDVRDRLTAKGPTLRDWIFGLGVEGVLRALHDYEIEERDEGLAIGLGGEAHAKYHGAAASKVFEALNAIRVQDGRSPLALDGRGRIDYQDGAV